MWNEGTDEYNLSILTEVVTGNLAIGYHGDDRPPEIVIPELLNKEYKNTASYQGNGLYCTRHEEDADTNGYGRNGYIYKIYIRDVNKFFHADFTTFNSTFRKPEYTINKKVGKALSDIESIPPESLRTLGIDIESIRKSHFNPAEITDRDSTLDNTQLAAAFPDYAEAPPRYIIHQMVPLVRMGLKTNDGSSIRECIVKALKYDGEHNRNGGVENSSKFFNNLYNWTNIATIVPGVTYSGRGDKRCILVYDWNNVYPVAYKKYGDREWIPVDYSPSGKFSKYRQKIIKPVCTDNRNVAQTSSPSSPKDSLTQNDKLLVREKLKEISNIPDLSYEAVKFLRKYGCFSISKTSQGDKKVWMGFTYDSLKKLTNAKMEIASSGSGDSERSLYEIDKQLKRYGEICAKLTDMGDSNAIRGIWTSFYTRESALPDFDKFEMTPSSAGIRYMMSSPSSLEYYTHMTKYLLEYASSPEKYLDYSATRLSTQLFFIIRETRKRHKGMSLIKKEFDTIKSGFFDNFNFEKEHATFSSWQYEQMQEIVNEIGDGRAIEGLTERIVEKLNKLYETRLSIGKISSLEDNLWKEAIMRFKDMSLFLEKTLAPELFIPASRMCENALAERGGNQNA